MTATAVPPRRDYNRAYYVAHRPNSNDRVPLTDEQRAANKRRADAAYREAKKGRRLLEEMAA